MAASVEDSRGDVKSASRTLDVLELLGSDPRRYSLGEIATALQIPKSSLHGLLRTMQRRNWVETDETGTRYGLGLRALLAGAAYVDADDVIGHVAPVLDWLAGETGETVHLGRLDGPDIVYLAKRESPHVLRLFSAVGRRLPAHATALGKAMLAGLDSAEVDRRLQWPLTALTPRTVTDPVALHVALREVQNQGYAVDDEENTEGIRCLAIALTKPGPGINAISCSVPVVRLDADREQRILTALQRARDDADLRLARTRLQ